MYIYIHTSPTWLRTGWFWMLICRSLKWGLSPNWKSVGVPFGSFHFAGFAVMFRCILTKSPTIPLANHLGFMSGWWFETWILFFHILGRNRSQLTKSIIFQRGRYTTNQILSQCHKPLLGMVGELPRNRELWFRKCNWTKQKLAL